MEIEDEKEVVKVVVVKRKENVMDDEEMEVDIVS
jgi:hypothetical protein